MKYIIYLVLVLFVSACTDNFEDFNTDKKNPASVNGEALFTNAQLQLAVQMNTPNVNRNIFELWAQYWNETTYNNEANYDMNRNQPEQVFRYFYREMLKDLDEAALIIADNPAANPDEEAANTNKLQIIEILNVFAYQRMVDIFGMIPYSEALDIGNVYPVYDMGASIYAALETRLDAALSGLNTSAGSFGSEDLIYGGDTEAWAMFGNTLKLKLGINQADVNDAKGRSLVEAAVNAGVFGSSADEALFPFQSAAPNYNPIHDNLVVSGRNDFVGANTLIDIMTQRNDPRLVGFFDEETVRPFPYSRDPATGGRVDAVFEEGENMIVYYKNADGSDNIVFEEGPFTIFAADSMAGTRVWLGGEYGTTSSWAIHTQVNGAVLQPTFPGLIMTYSEVLFHLAEAAARGYSVGGTEEEFYNAGITESILWWGGAQADADAYLALPDVAYATAEGDWKRKIGTQSWIASYINGFLGYTTWRRLDWPVMNISPDASGWPNEATDVTRIPVRFTFPTNEQTLNGANYTAAAEAIGGDNVRSKIFWDLYDANDGN